ncbi:MAG: response regulator [Patescibacteria group bacterium]
MENKKRIRVVLVEDDEVLGAMYDEALSLMGFSVGIAKSGQEGLRLIEENEPDMVILDIVMPDGDGFFVLKKIRENQKTKDVPVIMHTNLYNEADKAEAMRLGAKEYVIKAQVTPKQLAEIVKKYVKA